MIRVVLELGDRLVVEFAETDGQFAVEYGEASVKVIADLPDTTGRQGVIYEENFTEVGDDELSCQF